MPDDTVPFDLWKDNRQDRHYTLTFREIAEKFKGSRYAEGVNLDRDLRAFISSADGLGSAFENDAYLRLFSYVRAFMYEPGERGRGAENPALPPKEQYKRVAAQIKKSPEYERLLASPATYGIPTQNVSYGPDGQRIPDRWIGFNVADMLHPEVTFIAPIALPPKEDGYLIRRGPNVDDTYLFYPLPSDRAKGLKDMFEMWEKMGRIPHIRMQLMDTQPKEYKGRKNPGFHKDKVTGKWYCDQCGVEVPAKVVMSPYDYFGKGGLEHHCDKNPSDRQKALEHYRLWHHFEPTDELIVDIPEKCTAMTVLGRITRLDYESDKDVNDKGKREVVYFYHHFQRNAPWLAQDGKKRYHIVGNVRVHNPDTGNGLGLGMDDWETEQEKPPKIPRCPQKVTKLGKLALVEYKPEGGKKQVLRGTGEYVVAHPDGHWLYIAVPERRRNPRTKKKTLEYPHDRVKGAYLYQHHPESQIEFWIPPKDFLRLTGWDDTSPFSKCRAFDRGSYDTVRHRLERGQYVDPLFLDLERSRFGDFWQVIRHEGRHRAQAAMDIGIEKVPVIFYFRRGGDYITPPEGFNEVDVSLVLSEWSQGPPGGWYDKGRALAYFEWAAETEGRGLKVQKNPECQICGRDIKAASGIIAHHGYKRPGTGWQTASCMGARGLPYEVSCNLIPPVIERVSKYIIELEERIKDFIDNPPEKIIRQWHDFEHYRSKPPKEYIRPEGFDPNVETYRHSVPDTYENEYRHQLYSMRRQLKANQEFKDYLEKRLKDWKPNAQTAPEGENPETEYEPDEIVEVLNSGPVGKEGVSGFWKKQLNRMGDGSYLVEVYYNAFRLSDYDSAEQWVKTFTTELGARALYDRLNDMRKVKTLMEKERENPPKGLKIYNDVEDYRSGETFGKIIAEKDGKVVAAMSYSQYGDKVSVKFLWVTPEYRRQGIGTAIIEKLKSEFPGKTIDYGYTLPDGTAFVTSLPSQNPRYIVTAPHAEINPAEPHPHDWAVREVARELARLLNADLHLADRPRSKGDLNRPSTRRTPWRRELERSIRPGDVLLDIHSYPGDTDTDDWGSYDFIILRSEGRADKGLTRKLKAGLVDSGYRVLVMDSSVINDIVITSSDAGARAVLLEVNEDTEECMGPAKIAQDIAAAVTS